MQAGIDVRVNPGLRALVVEASLALARLDAERLEELALCCQALNRGLVGLGEADKDELAGQARDASGEMAVFARMLDATGSNLEVMNSLADRRRGRLEYGGPLQRRMAQPWALAEMSDGHY